MKFNTEWLTDTSDVPEWMLVDGREGIACLIAFGLGIVALIALWAVLA